VNDEQRRPLRDRLGRVGMAVVGLGLLLLVAAPVVASLSTAAVGSDGPVRDFFVRVLLVWLGISVVAIVAVGFWLWWGWDSPGDTMTDQEDL
jgi:hypothetical protein